ncbi:MAG TPA: hypothetical protein VHF01_10280 [Candidatus Acidoferrum sp.]|nr:hypothetical protein [Candidatus Acidoferrum sp.]
MSVLYLVLGSAAVGALVSSLVNAVVMIRIKKMETELHYLELALKVAEMKHQQVLAAKDWAIKEGTPRDVSFFDPLYSLIEYVRGIEEFRKTGKWAKGESVVENWKQKRNQGQ